MELNTLITLATLYGTQETRVGGAFWKLPGPEAITFLSGSETLPGYTLPSFRNASCYIGDDPGKIALIIKVQEHEASQEKLQLQVFSFANLSKENVPLQNVHL